MIHSGHQQIANAQTKLAEVLEERCAQANLNLKVCHCVIEKTLQAIPDHEMVALAETPPETTKLIRSAMFVCGPTSSSEKRPR